MAKISRDRNTATLHPRENLLAAGTLGSLNAEIIVSTQGCSTVSLDLRGTFSMTIEVSGTVDGTDWVPIPMRGVNIASVAYVAAVVGTAAGVFVGECGEYDQVRARVTAYPSGAATASLLASIVAMPDVLKLGAVTSVLGTAVGAAAAAVTLTLAAPGAGLRHYLTYLSINKVASALLVAAAAPVTVTTTNLPGALAFSFPADAAAQGTIDRWREDFAYPLASSAQNTATTIVAPATTSIIWRITAGYFVAP